MNDDLISRQALLESIERISVKGNVLDDDWVYRFVQEFPSIDAVKHGRWKYISFLTVECSECKTQIHDLEYSNFCPNCGAKMDETVDERRSEHNGKDDIKRDMQVIRDCSRRNRTNCGQCY